MASRSTDSRTIVLTGASAGVGRATARRFARPGARLALLARGREGLEATRREVEERGAEALVLPTDVADAGAVEAAADAAERRFGPIDVWINDAMVTVLAPVHRVAPADLERVTAVTYLGSAYGVMAALRRMLPRDRGKIVQVGSALAYRGIPLQAAYCGAKFAIRGFLDSLRAELLADGSAVSVTEVHLPAVNTPQFGWCRTTLGRHPQPLPPIFQPEVAADAIHFAAESDRREVWVGKPTVQTILGSRVSSSLLDRVLARVGLDGQQTDDVPFDPDRPDNLYEPVEGDRGAHGAFDDRATSTSVQLWLTEHRRALLGVAGAALCAGALLAPNGDGRR